MSKQGWIEVDLEGLRKLLKQRGTLSDLAGKTARAFLVDGNKVWEVVGWQ